MNNLLLLNKLIVQLKQAVDAKRWPLVQEIDNQIVIQLTALSEKKTLTVNEQLAIQKLQQLYAKIVKQCQYEQIVLQRKMAQHQCNREGITAYASIVQEL